MSDSTLITLIRSRYNKGWAGDVRADGRLVHTDKASGETETLPGAGLQDIAEALLARHNDDCHFQPYHVKDAQGQPVSLPRLRLNAWPALQRNGWSLSFSVIVVDPDDPEAHPNNAPASDAWRASIRQRVASLPPALRQGLGWYDTLRGTRLLWLLQPNLDLGSYLALLEALRGELARHDIAVDRLTDWTRLYRLARVLRDKIPQDLPVDLSGLGPLLWRPAGGLTPVPIGPDGSAASSGKTATGRPVSGTSVSAGTRSLTKPAAGPASPHASRLLAPFLRVADAHVPFVLPEQIPASGGPHGGRNRTLFKFGAQLRGQGRSDAQILSMLRRVNASNCQPPLDDSETVTIWRSVLQYEAGTARPRPMEPVAQVSLTRPVGLAPAKLNLVPALAAGSAAMAGPITGSFPATTRPEPAETGPEPAETEPVTIAAAPVSQPVATKPASAPAEADAELSGFAALLRLKRARGDIAPKDTSPPAAPQASPAVNSAGTSLAVLPDKAGLPDDLADWILALPAQVAQDFGLLLEKETLILSARLYQHSLAQFSSLKADLHKVLKASHAHIGTRLTEWVQQTKAQIHQERIAERIRRASKVFDRGSGAEIAAFMATQLECGGRPALVTDKGRLWQYSAGRGLWEALDKEMLHNMVAGYDGLPVVMGKDANGNLRVGDLRIEYRTAKDAALLLTDSRYNPGFFADAVDGLAFSDVFVCMQPDGGVTQLPLEASQRSIHGLPFPYEGHDAFPAQFVSMLQGCFACDEDRDSKIQLLREFIGICLVNKATDLSKALLMLGEGNNGKSAVLSVVQALFNGTLITAIQPSEMNKDTNLAELSRARLNLVHELTDREIEHSGAFKSLITGNLSYGRDLYSRSFSFLPLAGHMLAANDLPVVRDLSGGFWRRWLVLTFNREFTAQDAIPKLHERIIESELSLIAAWAIQGASSAVARSRYIEPVSSQVSLNEWKKGLDQVDEFLAASCDIVPLFDAENARIPHSGLSATKSYTTYLQWVQTSGHKQLTSHRLYRRLKALKVPHTHTKEGTVYGLKPRLSVPGRR